MPKMNVVRSVSISAPASEIFPHLNDFNNWTAWSPWLLMNPKAKVTVAEDNKSYKWEGDRVGSGNMKVLEEDENTFIDYDLNFLKPWKSHAKTSFSLKEQGDSTEVTWTMDSSLPFFMFFMKKMMEGFVGGDYERGLDMLKAKVETGSILSELDWKGESQLEGFDWIGIKTKTSRSEVGDTMQTDFGKIMEYAEANKENINGDAFSIYHKWDFVKGTVEYTAAIPVKNVPSELPSGFISGHIPNTKIYTLRHTGDYKHLGNAWSTMYNMQQGKELKLRKGIHPFEVYRNNPSDTETKDLITDVCFAVK